MKNISYIGELESISKILMDKIYFLRIVTQDLFESLGQPMHTYELIYSNVQLMSRCPESITIDDTSYP